jgi:hypothetical protein
MFLSEVLRVDIEASRAGDICGQVADQLSIYNPENASPVNRNGSN